MRGNPSRLPHPSGGWRSIPACAGEPSCDGRYLRAGWVYPRVCGGTVMELGLLESEKGLSPRVRGNPSATSRGSALSRSIPACAGEPCASDKCAISVPVYPRVCGGTSGMPASTAISKGLSPRVRGNPHDDHHDRPRPRSIPACAGEPVITIPICPQVSVYPRVCGGTGTACAAGVPDKGLSPRVRGNPARNCLAHWRSGSIPACAGEPASKSLMTWRQRVYPRVCGGTEFIPPVGPGGRGLSPRVRGNPPAWRYPPSARGSIPACAGEP